MKHYKDRCKKKKSLHHQMNEINVKSCGSRIFGQLVIRGHVVKVNAKVMFISVLRNAAVVVTLCESVNC